MGTRATPGEPIAERQFGHPRIYADANVPLGVVAFMRQRLGWDVLFVMEHPDLRRARDTEHFRLARHLRRTLVTLDRDYLDDEVFVPAHGAGVVILSAPDETGLGQLLARIDVRLFDTSAGPLPLDGMKLHVHPDWQIDHA